MVEVRLLDSKAGSAIYVNGNYRFELTGSYNNDEWIELLHELSAAGDIDFDTIDGDDSEWDFDAHYLPNTLEEWKNAASKDTVILGENPVKMIDIITAKVVRTADGTVLLDREQNFHHHAFESVIRTRFANGLVI